MLVGADGDRRNIPEAVLTGPVTMAGDCLGINGATVIWPHGTKIATDDPLTIDVPSLGRLRVGDCVDGMGGDEYVDHLPKGIDAVPSGVPPTRPSPSTRHRPYEPKARHRSVTPEPRSRREGSHRRPVDEQPNR